ncbi:ssDNA endonuclease and repair protein rad10, partial [Kappamyces sp. JEL0680]
MQVINPRRIGHAIQVNPNQKGSCHRVTKGNPLLEFLKGKVPWEYQADLKPDYVVGQSNCVLFLSLKYHRLHPEYIGTRLRDIHGAFVGRFLLVLVDV